MEERLQKTIARSGLASRRQAEKMIAEGRVKVGGEVVTQAGRKVDPSRDDIRVDGVRVRSDRPRRYLLLNKPVGYLTTRSDPRRRRTVMQLLPISLRSLYPVGRLDMSTSGLLLLTDDGAFAQRVAHPRYGLSKTYAVTVWGSPSVRTLERANTGVRVEGEWLRVASVKKLPGPRQSRGTKPRKVTKRVKQGEHEKKNIKETQKSRLRVVLSEGRNREIWRLFKALGHPVIELHREKVGFLDDRGLSSGAFRPLTPREISGLLSPRVSPPERAFSSRAAAKPAKRRAPERRVRAHSNKPRPADPISPKASAYASLRGDSTKPEGRSRSAGPRGSSSMKRVQAKAGRNRVVEPRGASEGHKKSSTGAKKGAALSPRAVARRRSVRRGSGAPRH